MVFYAPTILEQNVGLPRETALPVAGCIEFAFAAGSLVPSLGLDRFGRRKLMMLGSVGMAVSMMMISVLLSFQGTEKAMATSQATIAFLITVSFSMPSDHASGSRGSEVRQTLNAQKSIAKLI